MNGARWGLPGMECGMGYERAIRMCYGFIWGGGKIRVLCLGCECGKSVEVVVKIW